MYAVCVSHGHIAKVENELTVCMTQWLPYTSDQSPLCLTPHNEPDMEQAQLRSYLQSCVACKGGHYPALTKCQQECSHLHSSNLYGATPTDLQLVLAM